MPVLGESGDETLRRAPHFAEFVSIHRLRPSLLVADKRHAYRDPNSEARITFDQEIRFGTEPSSVCARGRLLTRAAVLEMKSKENLPPWLEAMVAQLRARRQSFSKYCLSVESDSTSGRHEAQCRFPRQHGLIDAFIRPDSPHDLE